MTMRMIFVSQVPTVAVAPSRLAVRFPHFVALMKPRAMSLAAFTAFVAKRSIPRGAVAPGDAIAFGVILTSGAPAMLAVATNLEPKLARMRCNGWSIPKFSARNLP